MVKTFWKSVYLFLICWSFYTVIFRYFDYSILTITPSKIVLIYSHTSSHRFGTFVLFVLLQILQNRSKINWNFNTILEQIGLKRHNDFVYFPTEYITLKFTISIWMFGSLNSRIVVISVSKTKHQTTYSEPVTQQ